MKINLNNTSHNQSTMFINNNHFINRSHWVNLKQLWLNLSPILNLIHIYSNISTNNQINLRTTSSLKYKEIQHSDNKHPKTLNNLKSNINNSFNSKTNKQ